MVQMTSCDLHNETIVRQQSRIEELERELADEKCQSHKNAVEAMCLEAENAALKARIDQLVEYVGTSASPELLKAVISRAERAEAEVAALKAALLTVLDQVDYTAGACSITNMVGACLPVDVITMARAAIGAAKEEKP